MILGVPQGTVLGPLLFIHINDLPKVRLLADKCVIQRQITNPDDHISLQHYLNCVNAWCDKCLMSHNGSKCELVTFSSKRSLSPYSYLLGNSFWWTSPFYKYLGGHISSKLYWISPTNVTISPASQTLYYFQRSFYSAPLHLRKLAYETYVRPILEFSAAV